MHAACRRCCNVSLKAMNKALLIIDKCDENKAQGLIDLGYPENEMYLDHMMEWMQDWNWPVARVLQPFLAELGDPIVSRIQRVLEGNDSIWKYWCILCLINEMPIQSAMKLKPSLACIIHEKTATPIQFTG